MYVQEEACVSRYTYRSIQNNGLDRGLGSQRNMVQAQAGNLQAHSIQKLVTG